MKPKFYYSLLMMAMMNLLIHTAHGQNSRPDSTLRNYKNIVRYNLSSALLFGFDKYIVLGYERVLSPKRSLSINIGKAALPKLVSIATDSFQVQKEGERTGMNGSIDYRFYLAKENKFNAPRGLYIGPYYAFNRFENEQKWTHKNNSSGSELKTNSNFSIHTFGFEVGYQLLLWKRVALDLLMVGPGMGFYKYEATFSGNINLNAGDKEQLLEALKQLLTQKFPGMNYVFSDKKIDADGVLKTTKFGYRYLMHIGYAF
jgi:hypothetical protein